MAFRTFFEWPGQMLSMMLEKWHGSIVVFGKNQAMKMMLEKAEGEEKAGRLRSPDWEYESDLDRPWTKRGTCQRPPEGWYCTRPAGHDGPCPTHRLPFFMFPNRPVTPRKTVVFNDEECKVVTADFGKIEERIIADYVRRGYDVQQVHDEIIVHGAETGRIDSRKENLANTPKSRNTDFPNFTEQDKQLEFYEEAYGKTGSEQGQQAQEPQRQEESAGQGSVPAPEAGTETAGA